ncbi:MAG: DUF4164 family protein [Alphaproteobacteria bacterium]|jgi:uncharacterized protein (DUF3084 family)|nr:DUF4164 family protein [Alphaproteobacteria bacterium]MDP6829614.1 DUF4164 family protein [Alphaproteobacteria bacterium]MDP6876383.1 DUF4164 family protein [Alphaproteobacteria bacterium]
MADDAGAKVRLEAAVQRLESALSRVVERGAIGAGDEAGDIAGLRQELNGLDSELTAVRSERDRLTQELAEARAEGAALQGAMDATSARLDTAIDAVHALLDE